MTYCYVLRRIPVGELPERRLFREMGPYLAVNWIQAVAVALDAISKRDYGLRAGTPPDIARAAASLWIEPVALNRDSSGVWWQNGQHRAEAMIRQGVTEAIVREFRLTDGPPLPGEIRYLEEA